MIIVTGGAGFIGSALVWGLNDRGHGDIVIVDSIGDDEQEHNIGPLQYEELISGDVFRERLAAGDYDGAGVEAVFHLGANASTVGAPEDYADVNVAFSQEVIRWCVDRGVRCVYVSSGATYGDGSHGYSDDHALFDELEPLNEYGKSKLAVDVWARDAGYLEQVAGLRYFNVYGPNEWHKGPMRSVVAKKFDQMQEEGVIELFTSTSEEYEDGGQMRDFIYVKDAVAATLFFLEAREANGVFNVGTGKARSWNDLARAMFAAVEKESQISYVEMPDQLKGQYQNYTQAEMGKLKAAGFAVGEMMSLEDGVADYVQEYLMPHRHLGE